MAFAAGEFLVAREIVDWVNQTCWAPISHPQYNRENMPPCPADWASFFASGFPEPFRLEPGTVASVAGFWGAVNEAARSWGRVRNISLSKRVGGYSNGGPIPWSSGGTYSGLAYLTIDTNIMGRCTISQGDFIRATDIKPIFDDIIAKWCALPVVSASWDECHNNCHDKCHGSGGFR